MSTLDILKMHQKEGVNPMCWNCINKKCYGTMCKIWTGCIDKKRG